MDGADAENRGASGSDRSSDATLLIARVEAGDSQAAEELLPLVYEQLRGLAGSYFRRQPSDHTLQPTALVHEAYAKMVNASGGAYRGSEHFCAVAATAMRQILATHAESKRAAKRGGGAQRVPLNQVSLPSGPSAVDVVDLDAALRRLEEVDEGLSRIVELRYFGGMTLDQAADFLEISRRSVARKWRQARAFLNLELTGTGSS
ncbi:MAG: ECF-type sigma factor [Planctomycetota bacterium]